MRLLTGLLLQNKFFIIETILLMGLFTALWRIENAFVSFVFGVSAGYLLYRLGNRIAKRGASRA
ncbi:hypothetical protein SAMN05444266_101535 [Chitinophaga jiangningensis]|uniref:Uncharacterized protein n=1 Tax=Chitinophaga jiangningensis TaxID=1419482 RepID=A0A1M6WA22_9BACT|nr:hypothetical protein [Chitinophaga jiangningensis]SHK90345.1 hypothetical protein SAMN05444266_101535 [Chitinophaga jiangningensis]